MQHNFSNKKHTPEEDWDALCMAREQAELWRDIRAAEQAEKEKDKRLQR